MKFYISTATSRNQTKWANKLISWEDFVNKFRNPARTQETVIEYFELAKPLQDQIKDIGGYVGGYLNGGKRKINCVRERQLICLDIDDSESISLPDIKFKCLVHTTHKHTSEHPRYRIIIPCSQKLSNDEYEFISRYLAKELGIFDSGADKTTYQPSRLMYWPSCPIDGQYIFKEYEGELYNTEEVFKNNPHWKKEVYSGIPEKDFNNIQKLIEKKQQDPTTKSGVIAAFCKEYDIHSCIEKFLGHLYTPTDDPNRFTWAEGSTTGGVLLFEGLYSYSFHSTDPSSMRLCNAYDLVRLLLHKGDDKKALDWCSGQEGVGTYLAIEEFGEDFQEWQRDLEYNKNGKIKDTIENLRLILTNEYKLRYDEFRLQVLMGDRVYKSSDDNTLLHSIETKYGLYSPRKLISAIEVSALQNSFHPIRDYFDSLPPWDGIPRLDNLLIDYFQANDNIYVKESTRLTLVGGVKRIYEPGCELQTILVLKGDQGAGKSYLFRMLCPDENYFSDSLTLHTIKDAKITGELLRGKFIMEIPEMAGQSKADTESIKAFIVRRVDNYRTAYGRITEDFPRQCLLFASTNKEYLQDTTGNRRFLTIDVRERTSNNIDKAQVWAEAKYIYERDYVGEENKLILSAEARKIAEGVANDNMEVDERTAFIEEFINRKLPLDWNGRSTYDRIQFLSDELSPTGGKGLVNREYITTAEIWCECYQRPKHELKRAVSNEIVRSFVALGYTEKITVSTIYGKCIAYKKKT